MDAFQYLLCVLHVLVAAGAASSDIESSAHLLPTSHHHHHHQHQQQQQQPKVMFLFLLKDAIRNEDIWSSFFKGVPSNRYQVFAHQSDPMPESFKYPSAFNVTLVENTRSAYCDLAGVMNWMYDKALIASHNDRDSFVSLSGNSLPVKPFQEIYHKLCIMRPVSFLCVSPTEEWAEVADNLYIPKTHQWVILNRTDAARSVSQYHKHLNKSRDGPILASPSHQGFQGCSEEYWFVSAISGPVNTTSSSSIYQYPSKVEQGCCTMYVWWEGPASSGGQFTMNPPITTVCINHIIVLFIVFFFLSDQYSNA
jgi:hypothetical protein